MPSSRPTSKEAILLRLQQLGEGAVFVPKDFLDVASRTMIDVTLRALAKEGRIRPLARGIYDRPRQSVLLKQPVSPKLEDVAETIARKFGWHIVPSGAHAANLLGLTTQVPSKAVYLSDGPTKTVSLGKQSIHFKNARPKDLGREAGPTTQLFIQALKHVGKNALTPDELDRLRRRFPPEVRRTLARETRYTSDWIYAAARELAGPGEGTA